MLITNATELPRFMTCNGSRLMGGAIPPTAIDDTTQRDEGTAAHYMATAVFNGHFALDELSDKKAPNGVYLAEEITTNVAKYLEITAGYLNGSMECDTSHDNSPHWVINGRTDFIGYKTLGILDVTDFKYGWRIVEPEMNWTMISHAIGWCTRNQHTLPEIIDFNIFQPRPYHPEGPYRTWSINYSELMQLRDRLNATLCNPSDQLVTSNHCGDCRALVECPAARLAEMNAIDATTNIFQDDMSDDHLSQALDNLHRAETIIEDRKKAFQELAKHRIKTGRVINNYSVELGYGHRAWNEGVDAGLLLAMTGKVLSTEKLVTPAEAERRGVNEATIKALTGRPMTGVKLVRVKASKKASKLFDGKQTTKG